jgi:hypothetical protein
VIHCLRFIIVLFTVASCAGAYAQDTLKVGQVFDFEIGDEFHYMEDVSYYNPFVAYKLDRITILDRRYSPGGDTLFYRRQIEGYTQNMIPSTGPYPYEMRYYFHSSEDELKYTNLDSTIFWFLAEGHFSYLKDYNHGEHGFEVSDSMVYESGEFCQRTINGYQFSDFTLNDRFELGEGLGITYLSTEYEECQCHTELRKLQYYRKGNDSCGTPDYRSVADWYPMLDSRNTWYTHIYEYFSWDINTEVIGLGQDTLIADTSYFRVYRAVGGAEVPDREYGFIRGSGERIYYRTGPDRPERLLYDFNITPGDTVTVYNLMDFDDDLYIRCDFICDSVRVENFYQVPRRVYYLARLSEDGIIERWIEGIGSYSGILHNYNGYVGGDAFYLSCVKQSGMLIFRLSEPQPCIKTTIGLEERKQSLPRVRPNPVGINQPLIINNAGVYGFFELYNALGILVFRQELVSSETSLAIDLKAGIYFFRLIGPGGQNTATGTIVFE